MAVSSHAATKYIQCSLYTYIVFHFCIYAGSAHLILPPLAKLLYQISEASTRSEIIGIPSGPSSLPPILLKSILLQLIKVSETKPELLAKCLGHVRVCVGSVVREGVRMGALSSMREERLYMMEVIVEVVMRAQVNYIKQVSFA